MLVFHYRNGGTHLATDTNIDDVCKLLASTGYVRGTHDRPMQRPQEYPEKYFSRIQLSEDLLQMVFGRLQNDDIYNLISVYPKPQHRLVISFQFDYG